MNQRFEGWKLAVALLIPAAIIAAAAWIAFQAFGEDEGQVATAGGDDTEIATPVPTDLPETQPVAEPTEAAAPTPIPLPTAAPAPVVTPAPATTGTPVPTAAAAATSAPAPAPTASGPAPTSGPRPTATPDASAFGITCGVDGGFPTRAGINENIGPISAVVTPASEAESYRHSWNFGNGRTAVSPRTGFVTYEAVGKYTITVTSLNTTTNEETFTTCGTITVGTAPAGGGDDDSDAAFSIACTVAPQNTAIKWEDATLEHRMQVIIKWTPRDTVLNLQYDFDTRTPLEFVTGDTSPNSKVHAFFSLDGVFNIRWINAETEESGRLECPAYPPQDGTGSPSPTSGTVPTTGPAPTTDPNATAVPTSVPTGSPTPLPTPLPSTVPA